MGALLLIIGAILFIALALWLAWGASRFSANIVGKLILAGIVLFFFYWVVFGRTNLVELEFKRLCEQEAEIKIHKTVALQPEWFDKYGNPEFKRYTGARQYPQAAYSEIGGRYLWILRHEPIHSLDQIEKEIETYIDLETNEVLAETVTFRYLPKGIPAPGHVNWKRCLNIVGLRSKDIFKKSEQP